MEIRDIPTVELHRHWEAGMSPEVIATLAQRNQIGKFLQTDGKPIDGVDPQDPDSIRAYTKKITAGFKGPRGFQNFLIAFRALSSVLRTLDDVSYAIFEQLREEQQAGSIHTELRGSPMSLIKPLGGASIEDILLAMRVGVQKAYDELDMSGSIITCFSREKGEDQAPRVARAVSQAVPEEYDQGRFIGMDIAGAPEKDFPPYNFWHILGPALESGVCLTIHAGEQCRPPDFSGAPVSFIEQAINMGASRIGHGVSLMDPSSDCERVKTIIKEREVGIEACPTSNDCMGIIEFERHPLKSFLDQGLLVSACTDDPLFFGAKSVREMLELHCERLRLTPDDIVKMTRNGIQAAFVSSDRKQELSGKLEERLRASRPR